MGLISLYPPLRGIFLGDLIFLLLLLRVAIILALIALIILYTLILFADEAILTAQVAIASLHG